MRRYCLALDLVNDPELIREYDERHRHIWPEIKKSILDSGITTMDIYRFGNRLMMIMETDDHFSFDHKADMDNANPTVQRWEQLMWKYQQALPGAATGEKWVVMKQIFSLDMEG